MDLRVTQSRSEEHQKEANQLHGRTEMQASIQGGVPSQLVLAGALFQKEKHNLENAQVVDVAALKGKKRKKAEHFSEPKKKERLVIPQDLELNVHKQDLNMKADEIAAITDKDGALLSLACVDKLIILMQQERADGMKRLAVLALRRSMLAGVIAATDREDCLNRFVQLGGLPLLDDWLQDAHKGKAIDGGSPKEGEKAFEDLLLTLLCALDKLPVGLDALKTCIVGRSVNTLRGHKNIEIQKNARKLVDIWKKRVEAEMKQSGEGKPVQGISWSCKQHPTDSLHSPSSSKNGGSDLASKAGGLVNSARAASNVSVNSSEGISDQPETVPPLGKASNLLSSSLPGHKDICRPSNSAADFSAKEEKSSCSSHSQNHASRWSNTSVKTSSALLNSKVSGPISHSAGIGCNGPVGPITNAIEKESALEKPMWSRSNTGSTDKLVHLSALSEGGSCEGGNRENLGAQRLVVRLSNPGKGPLCVASGGAAACVTTTMQERISRLVTSELPDVKSRSTITGSEVDSTPRCCHASIPVFTEGDIDLQSAVDHTKGANEGEKVGEELCRTTNLSPKADGKSVTEEKYLPVGIPYISTSLAQKKMTEISILADKNRRVENSSQVCEDAENSSAQPKSIAVGLNDGSSGMPSKVAVDEAVSCQGVNPALANTCAQTEQGAECVDLQSRCKVDSDLGYVEVQDVKCMPSSLSPATSSSDNAQSLESSRNRVKLAFKGQAIGDGKRLVSRKSFGEDKDMLEDKSSVGASSSEGDLATVDHVAEVKRDSSIEIRDVGGTETGDRQNPAYELKENATANFTYPSNESMHKGSGSGPENSEGTGSDRSLRLIQNLASDLEQFIGRSSESHISKMESVSGSSEEDALEVARQVAKEVEQEMQRYSKPLGSTSSEMEMQDGNVSATHESPETIMHSHDLVKKSSCNPDHEGRGKTAAETLDPSNIGDVCSNPGVSYATNGSINGKFANSAIFPVAIDFEDAKVQEINCSTNVDVSHKNSALEPAGTSSESPQLLMPASSTIPCLSGNRGSGLDFHNAKPCELNSPSVEPIPSEKALVSSTCADSIERPIFDLNEGFNTDDEVQDDLISSLPLHVTTVDIPEDHVVTSNGLTAPIAVIASANATFIPPASPPINKAYSWKGSAATSAFRPAEPRRTSEVQNYSGDTLASELVPMPSTKQARAPLDIDLNIADDRLIEGMWLPSDQSEERALKMPTQAIPLPFMDLSVIGSTNDGFVSSSLGPMEHIGTRPDLDLNRVDESDESNTHLMTNLGVPGDLASMEPNTQARCSLRSVTRDFDLNDGPVSCFEETAVMDEQQQHLATSVAIPLIPSIPARRMTPEIVNIAPWFSPGNPFSTLRLPTYPGNRAEAPYTVTNAQPFLGPGMGLAPFSTELFRAGAAISSSPSISFPAAGPYQYPAFPFGAGFAFGSTPFGTNSTLFGEASSSTSFPSVSSQMVNSCGLVPAFMQPPYATGFPGVCTDSRGGAWGRPNFDLNAGPDFLESEVREDGLNVRHPLMVTNQMEAFQQVGSGGVLKRKGPEGGWETYKSGSRHPTWH